MELDEYEYLERGVENPAAETKKERRSTDGDNRSSRRSMSEERSGGERADRERSSSQLDKDQRHRSSRDDDQDRVRVHRSSERGDDSDRVRPSRERDDDRDRVRRCRESDLDRDRRCRESDLDRDRRSRESDLDRDRRSRERSYDDRHHRRSRDRDHRSRDYEEDMERERRRRRSSSRLYEREVESERVRSRDRLESMERERRRFKERRESVEPEADPERDQRTVFAYQMPLKATERDVYEFFSQAGKVRDVRLIMDRISRRSKGVGYIEFYDAMSVPHAIALSTRLLLGQPVLVKPSEAEKNLIQSNSTVASGVTGAASDRKIYVGNLHYNITEALLRQIFEVFGPLELVQLPLDPTTGYCKGYGFIQFQQLEHAKAARSLNGTLDIAGRIIKVSAVTDHVGGQSTGTNTADFDDEDGGGLALNARSRAILMQKLDRTGTATSIVESLGIPVLNGAVANQQTANLPMPLNAMPMVPPVNAQYLPPFEPIGDPSECLLLKNMFDPSVQVDPDLYMDVKEDVEDECSKFGSVKHIFVDKNTGFVYLRFDSVVSATDCQRAMNKRWYGGKTISATFMRPHEYHVRVASDT